MTSSSTDLALAARRGQRPLAAATGETRSRCLEALADRLEREEPAILAANRIDMERAIQDDLRPALLHRLELTPAKIAGLVAGVRQLAGQTDPVGAVRRRTRLDDGLVLRQVTSPVGVLLILFESRPDALIQIGSLALRTGNAVLLKGGSEAARSNAVLAGCLRHALEAAGLDPDAVLLAPDRETVHALLELDSLIDLVIPRGSGQLVRTIQESTRIPVLGHAEGICHLYVDRGATPEMAVALAVDGKCDYPSACNAVETLLIHEDALPLLQTIGSALAERGVRIKADPRARAALPAAEEASEADYATEWGDLVLSIRTVESLDAALRHITHYGSGHTEAIVTSDETAAERFLAEVDAASVFVNASTRFADGYRYGLGAEVGISTGRIHARGPVGAEGLLTTRWLLVGSGHVAADYGPQGKSFLHHELPLAAAGTRAGGRAQTETR